MLVVDSIESICSCVFAAVFCVILVRNLRSFYQYMWASVQLLLTFDLVLQISTVLFIILAVTCLCMYIGS